MVRVAFLVLWKFTNTAKIIIFLWFLFGGVVYVRLLCVLALFAKELLSISGTGNYVLECRGTEGRGCVVLWVHLVLNSSDGTKYGSVCTTS